MPINHFDNIVRCEPRISFLKTLAVPEAQLELMASCLVSDKILAVLKTKQYIFFQSMGLTSVVMLDSRDAALAILAILAILSP